MAAAEVNRGPRLTEHFWAAFTTLKLCSHVQINVAMWPDMNINMRGGERAKSEGTAPTGRPADGTERRPDTKKKGAFPSCSTAEAAVEHKHNVYLEFRGRGRHSE